MLCAPPRGAEAGDRFNVLSGSMRSASAQGPERVLAGGVLGWAADGVQRKVVDRAPREGRPDPWAWGPTELRPLRQAREAQNALTG